MKNQIKPNKGFVLFELLVVFQIILALTIGTAWCVNLYKLINCDFEAPYKGEIVHAIGLIPPAALVTVWFDEN